MSRGLFITIPGFEVENIDSCEEEVHIIAHSIACGTCCPGCGHVGQRVHSWYRRHPMDLPCLGKVVQLVLSVRRFFCDNAGCERRTFAERFEPWLACYARRTRRVLDQVELLSLATGGEVSSMLAQPLGIPTSAATFIRRTRRQRVERVSTPRVLGVDDWAMRKGKRYGTILVDLEIHRPIDLLPDREDEPFAAWLKAHPGVEIISRDRGTQYIEGATKGAPNALQVADRWHLLHNLRETVQELLEQHRSQLMIIVESQSDSETPTLSSVPAKKKAWAYNREERYVRYEKMVELAGQGLDNQAIAQAIGVSITTVRKYLAAGQFPEWQPRPVVSKWLAPYVPYLQQRWDQGCPNSAQLWRALCKQRHNPPRALLSQHLAPLPNGLPTEPPPVQTPQVRVVRRYSPREASWLLVNLPDALDRDQTHDLNIIRQRSPELEQAYQLAQAFGVMIRERQPQALQPWMRAALDSTLDPLRKFVFGLHRDLKAVQAALSLPWSNGQTEGQVNRLKPITRHMYVHPNFDLLRLRVLLRY